MVMGLINAARDMVTIKRLLTQAEAEARQVGEEVPGPEHLLLAATTLPDGTASQALQRVGVSAAGLRTAINEVHAQALAGAGIEVDDAPDDTAELRGPLTGVFRATPQAQRVFRQAAALSKSTKPSQLQGAHVVAASCDLERGTLVRALTVLGVDRDRLRQAAHAEARTP
jgi:ATP-dependent Clp protease ATP-binding subunit ClpA